MLRRGLWSLWRFAAWTIIALALLVSLLRLGWSQAHWIKPYAERYISERTGTQVQIDTLDTHWRLFGPELQINGLRLQSADGKQSLLSLRRFDAALDFWRSLLTLHPVMRRFELDGLQVGIALDPHGVPTLVGFTVSEGGDEASARWVINSLLRQRGVSITDTQLRYYRRRGDAIDLQIPELSLRNTRREHQASGALLVERGGRARFELAFSDYPLAADDWLKLYLESDALELAHLPISTQALGVELADGDLGLKLWAEWRGGSWQQGQTQFALRDLRLQSEQTPAPDALHIGGALAFSRDQAGHWLWRGDALQVRHGERDWPALQISGEVQNQDDQQFWRFDLQHLVLQNLLDVVSLSDHLGRDVRKQLQQMQPRAGLPNVQLDLHWRADQLQNWAAVIGFADLQYSHADWPQVNGLSGRLLLHRAGGALRAGGRELSLDFHRLFRAPLHADTLDIAADWQMDDSGVVLNLPALSFDNADLRLLARGRFDFPREGEAEMSLVAGVSNINAARKSAYLPTGIMDEGLVRWLDDAVRAGRLPQARAFVRGPLKAFPYADNDGVFVAEGELAGAILQFQPQWPALTDLNAHLHFTGQDMNVQIRSAQTGNGLQARDGVAKLPLRADGVLTVDSQFNGRLATAREYILATPLQANLDALMQLLELDGDVYGKLQLGIPLADGAHSTVRARVAFDALEGLLNGPDLWLSNLAGEVQFAEFGVTGGEISGEVLGGRMRGRLSGDAASGNIEINGDASVDAVQTWLPHIFSDYIDGSLAYQGHIRLPARESSGLRVRVNSEMLGVVARLPAPYGKRADETRAAHFEYELGGERETMLARYGDDVAFQSRRNGTAERHAEILLGGTPYAGHRPGLTVRGRLAQVEAKPWIELLADATRSSRAQAFPLQADVPADVLAQSEHHTDPGTQTATTPLTEIARQPALALDIGSVDFYGVEIANAQLGGSGGDEGYRLHLRAPTLNGQVLIARQGPLQVVIDELRHEAPPETETGDVPDTVPETESELAIALLKDSSRPDDWPDMDILCRQCRIWSRDLGRVDVRARSVESDKQFQVRIQRDGLLDAELEAWWRDTSRETQVTGTLRSADLGKLMGDWRWDLGIRESSARLGVDLRWPGNPAQLRTRQLQGALQLKLERGHIALDSDGKERFARVFSLLSLQSITRRLSLEFGDLFRDGFFYDDISGSFTVQNGVAYTQDARITGVSADIDIRGATDLAARTLDQQIYVAPKLSSSLPVLAGWVINPPAGFVVWLMNKLFIEPVVKVVTGIEYSVTGSWDAPEMIEQKRTEGEIPVPEQGLPERPSQTREEQTREEQPRPDMDRQDPAREDQSGDDIL